MSTVVNPFVAAVAMAPGLLLMLLGVTGLRRVPRLVHASAVAFAAGLALLAVPLLIALPYLLRMPPTPGPLVLWLAFPALAFCGGLAIALRRREYEGFRIFGFSLVALLPLYFLAFYVALFSACSFGDCL